MCCRTSRSFADLVGTDLRADHTVIDTGHHRLLIGTIIVAPANDRYPGDPVGSARPANGSLRRVSSVAPRPRDGPLTEPTADAQPWPRERVLMPPMDRFDRGGETGDPWPLLTQFQTGGLSNAKN